MPNPNSGEPPPPAYVDPASGETYPIAEPRWRSDAGGPLMITALPGIGRDMIDTRVRSLWRYGAALPVEVADPVTMGEGLTPLVSREWRGVPAQFKLECLSPTGSFKDRGASVMLSILRAQGVTRVLEDSSGNGGAAIAAYAAAGGLKAKILVPASTPPGKIVQTRAYGAEVELIAGTRQDVSEAAVRQAATIFYAGHNWQPLFLQGTKTLAYELWEDLKFAAPDNVIIPTGAGSVVMGCDIGFGELRRRGEIERLPRLFAAQASNLRAAARELHRRLRRSCAGRGLSDHRGGRRRSRAPCGPAKSWRRSGAPGARPSRFPKPRSKGRCSNSQASASMSSQPRLSPPPRSPDCWRRGSSGLARRRCWC